MVAGFIYSPIPAVGGPEGIEKCRRGFLQIGYEQEQEQEQD